MRTTFASATSIHQIARAITMGCAAAGLALHVSSALAEPPSTTLNPAGHSIAVALAAGTAVEFDVDRIAVRCQTSTTMGQIPSAPKNHNPSGPIEITISPPTFGDGSGPCSTNLPFTTVKATANATGGPWRIALAYDPAGSTGTLIVPQAGLISESSGLTVCRLTLAPSGPISVLGKVIAATPHSLPKIDFSAGVSVPITVTGGFGCPTAAKAGIFRAIYEITDATDGTQTVSLGP